MRLSPCLKFRMLATQGTDRFSLFRRHYFMMKAGVTNANLHFVILMLLL
jgi:hypothetical protein